MTNTKDKRYFGIDVKLDTAAAQAAARRMCEHQNLRVGFDLSPNDAPYTDGQCIHIESPAEYTTKAALNMWWAKLVHETRHNTTRGSQCFDIAKREKLDMKSLHGFMFNLFEDCVVDNIDRGTYVGQDEASDWFHSFLFDQHTLKDKAKEEMWYNNESPEEGVMVATGFLLEGLARQEYMPSMIGKVDSFLTNDKHITSAIRDKFDEIRKGDWQERLTKLALGADDKDSKAEDVWKFTNDFLEEVFDQPPYSPPRGAGDEDADGLGDGTSQAAGNQDSEGKSDSKTYAEMLFEEMARDDHEPIDGRKNSTIKGVDMGLVYGPMSNTYVPLPPDRKIIVDYDNKKLVTELGHPADIRLSFEDYANNRHEAYTRELANNQDNLATQVKRYIQSETRKKQLKNRKKGTLDKNKLFKLGVPDAGKDWQDRVFWTQENKYTVDNTVVSLLCDISGSMSGDKEVAALRSMDMLGDVCRALKINYEMAGFTTISGNAVSHFLYKPFNKRVQRTEILARMVASTECMNANGDGENIKIAYNRLKAQEAKRRILIVLSDGYPAFRGGDISWFTREVINQIQKEGRVEVHGIGICSSSVKGFYDSYSVLHNPEELEACLLSVLKNKIIRFK